MTTAAGQFIRDASRVAGDEEHRRRIYGALGK